MDIETYQQKVIGLFTGGAATEEQWKEMANAVLQASENNSDNTIAIDLTIDPESVEADHAEHWTCQRCHSTVPPSQVTFEELHDGCGGRCS